jgi:hypothetical protein
MNAATIAQALDGRRSGDGWVARCPAHDDQHASLSLADGEGGRVIVRCHAGCSQTAVIAALRARSLWPTPAPRTSRREAKREVGRQEWELDWAGGKARHIRLDYPDGSKRLWWEPRGVKPAELLYEPLKDINDFDVALVVEGEKAADAAAGWAVASVFGTVCGAGSTPVDAVLQPIAQRFQRVILWPDNDDAGRNHMNRIGARLLALGARDIRIVDWPNAPTGGDAADFKGTVPKVQALLDAARPFELKAADKLQRKSDGERESQATQLVNLALTSVSLFHHGDETFAMFPVREHIETHALKSKGFRRWLAGTYFEREQKVAAGDAVRAAIETLAGHAQFRGEEREVYVRVAGHDGKLYLDLCDPDWRAVEITRDGWCIVESKDCPVQFRRAHGMRPLPPPERGGSIDDLCPFLNTASEADFRLVVGFLVACYRDRGPYPVLVLHGDPGAAKSTTARVLRDLVDPNDAPVRSEPREARDLMIAASNGWLIAFDNLSHLPSWLSDSLCRMSTGGGFSTRELYSDGDEVIFDAQRPVILTGIEEIATRGDLLDRAIPLYLPRIDESQRLTEAQFHEAFDRARPRLLGVVLDAISYALRNLGNVRLERLPRLADFAAWVEAAAPALGWAPGAFLNAYAENRATANDVTLAASPVAEAIRALPADFTGTATELLILLNGMVGEIRDRAWPRSPRGLSNALRRISANLAAIGVRVTFGREPGRRLIQITRTPAPSPAKGGNVSSSASSSSQTQENQAFFRDANCDASVAYDANGDDKNWEPLA